MSFIDEIHQQPEALRALASYLKQNGSDLASKIRDILERVQPTQIIFVGMGSSLYASYIPCTYLCRRGIRAHAYEAFELLSSDHPIIDDHTLLIAVSQSGNSTETVDFCEVYKSYPMITVTNQENGNLARYGDLQLFLQAGDEFCTATKSYTNTVGMLVFLAYALGGAEKAEFDKLYLELNQCADIIASMLSQPDYGEKLTDYFKDQPVLTLVGSGSSYTTTLHSQLVFVEAAREQPLPFTAGQFIHGPLEIINEKFGCILFDFEPNARKKIDDVLEQTEMFGGKTMIFTNRADLESTDRRLVLYFDLENRYLSPAIEVVPMELMVYTIGQRKGTDPGTLHRVHK